MKTHNVVNSVSFMIAFTLINFLTFHKVVITLTDISIPILGDVSVRWKAAADDVVAVPRAGRVRDPAALAAVLQPGPRRDALRRHTGLEIHT